MCSLRIASRLSATASGMAGTTRIRPEDDRRVRGAAVGGLTGRCGNWRPSASGTMPEDGGTELVGSAVVGAAVVGRAGSGVGGGSGAGGGSGVGGECIDLSLAAAGGGAVLGGSAATCDFSGSSAAASNDMLMLEPISGPSRANLEPISMCTSSIEQAPRTGNWKLPPSVAAGTASASELAVIVRESPTPLVVGSASSLESLTLTLTAAASRRIRLSLRLSLQQQ